MTNLFCMLGINEFHILRSMSLQLVCSVMKDHLKSLKVAFMGLFQHYGHSAYCILTPTSSRIHL